MLGNVSEWVQDGYALYRADTGVGQVFRGGAGRASTQADRLANVLDDRHRSIGFRCLSLGSELVS